MLRNKQRGYMNLDGLGSLLVILACAIFVVGFLFGMATPSVWSYVKPWVHAITA